MKLSKFDEVTGLAEERLEVLSRLNSMRNRDTTRLEGLLCKIGSQTVFGNDVVYPSRAWLEINPVFLSASERIATLIEEYLQAELERIDKLLIELGLET